MNPEIKITVLNIDEADNDFTKYKISLCNGNASVALEFYEYLDCFKEFAEKLEFFPKNANDSITFQIGENSEQWAYFLRLKVYCYEPNGNSTIYVEVDNHGLDTDRIKSVFFIKTLPASLNKLGQKLNSWNPKLESEVMWKTD
jgi:hypothetical protein